MQYALPSRRPRKILNTAETVAPYASFAHVYDALLGRGFFDRLRQVFEALARRYDLRCQSAADVACGTGIFVRYLRLRGIPVVYGVDRSPAMLRLARTRNRGSGACFLRQDFYRLHLPQPVDLITCNFDSLNYLLSTAALLRALQMFRANLKPGGSLIFDMVTSHQPWRGQKPRTEHAVWKGIRFQRSMRMHPRTGLQTSLVRITANGRTGLEVHRQRAYPRRVVVALLRRAGFLPLGVHDFNSLGSPSRQTRRVVYVARAANVFSNSFTL